MFFKNLLIYRLKGMTTTLEQFEEQLGRGAFERCASHQAESRGWVSPRKDGALIHASNHQWLIALKTEQRLLPASVINDEVKERADKLTDEQGYAPGRKQLRELKERVTEELMPRAFTRSHTTYAWLDINNGWFVIDAGNQGKAEAVIEHLRQCLDEFPLAPFHTQLSPTAAMADWLAGEEAPSGFTIDRDCELKACSEEKALVKYARGPLDLEQIKTNLAAGKLPTKLALTWDDRISFVLTDKQEVKRLAFLDILKEEAEKNAEHADEQFDADFSIMTGELTRFLAALTDALGGEVIDLADQGGGAPAASSEPTDDESTYNAAVKIVIANQRASISLIQRHLRIGYNRAARLIERMEQEGLVSAMNAQGAREVTA